VEYLTGGSGPPLLFLHGAHGLDPQLPLFDQLTERFTVYAPWHPGFGETTGLERLDDVIDLAIYYHDLIDALGLEQPVVVGHSIGGMIAAEAAALCSHRFARLVLVAPLGLWRDDAPVPDFFTMGPAELAPLVWHDATSPAAQAAATMPESQEAVVEMMITRAQALAASGKFLWPIPDKGLKKRIHRIAAPTLLLWGESDRLSPTALAADYQRQIRGAQLTMIPAASHMVLAEQPQQAAQAIVEFAGQGSTAPVPA
jgi:pimeloyl-ACP methyl ester carboxylesterase